ncbi:MAG: hypothetical protein HQM08_10460 [Candidatus Riflebacteria bacterium]|nr:hypothetical protein [Candidatus Riflebacteria bacterium]
MDITTKKIYNVKNDFIESLTHDSYVIQGTRLKQRRRNELEAILAVFDPDNVSNTEHILNIDETTFPNKYREIIRRLREAAECDLIRETMYAEDEVLGEIIRAERLPEKALEDNNQLIKTLEEKDKALEEKDKALEEKSHFLEKIVSAMIKSGFSVEKISEETGIREKKSRVW